MSQQRPDLFKRLAEVEQLLAENRQSIDQAKALLQETDHHPAVVAELEQLEFHRDELARYRLELMQQIAETDEE